MEKLPTRTSMLLLLFLSPCIVHGQYFQRGRGEGPGRVPRGGPGPAPIPYHDYAQPHSIHHQNPNQILIPNPKLSPNINLNAFSSRKGPFDSIMERAKSWLPGSTGEVSAEPKMRDAHRVPNPPKYPLYDLPTIGMATPPPAPLMHPMAQIPTGNYNYEEESQVGSYSNTNDLATAGSNVAHNRGPSAHHGRHPPSHNRKKPLRGLRPKHPPRGPHPFRPNNKKRPHGGPGGAPPNRRQHQHHQRQRPRGPPPQVQNRPNRLRAQPQKEEGFEHPMASNISPVNSPALGRPLDFDEYMKRPSHSFTDDPWNFDPFAAQMNQGMNTYALKYNYDPLGMNNLDNKANSHLDPAKLSYPGDYYNREVTDSSTNSQLGGWDRPPSGYNGYMNSNANSGNREQQQPVNYDTSLTNPLDGGRSGPLDPFASGSDNLNSFNLFQQSQQGNGNPPLGPTATVDLESLQPPSEDAKIEFTIETSMDHNGSNGQNGQNPNDNSKIDNFAGLSDNYSPYGADTAEGEPIGPPFGNLGDSNQDPLQPPASFSYSRTQDYGMRNRRANMLCQYGNVNCLRRQFQRNLVIPTNAPNMLYNPNVIVQEQQSQPQIYHSHPHGHQFEPQALQQQQMLGSIPVMRQGGNYYPTGRELQYNFRRQMNLARQMNQYNSLARGEMAMETQEHGQQQIHPQTHHQHQMHGHAVPRSDHSHNVPEGLQIFSELMKPGNPNLLSQSAKVDARNNLLKVLTQ